MPKPQEPMTAAIRFLRAHKLAYGPRAYAYEDRGGTAVAARELGVDHHLVIKTLIMQDENKNPLLVLMHGDQEVSTKNLARLLNVKLVEPCDPAAVTRLTGYQVGGVSPFGLRKALPVYVEQSILNLPVIYINGGKRGFLLEMSPADLARALNPTPVQVGYS